MLYLRVLYPIFLSTAYSFICTICFFFFNAQFIQSSLPQQHASNPDRLIHLALQVHYSEKKMKSIAKKHVAIREREVEEQIEMRVRLWTFCFTYSFEGSKLCSIVWKDGSVFVNFDKHYGNFTKKLFRSSCYK